MLQCPQLVAAPRSCTIGQNTKRVGITADAPDSHVAPSWGESILFAKLHTEFKCLTRAGSGEIERLVRDVIDRRYPRWKERQRTGRGERGVLYLPVQVLPARERPGLGETTATLAREYMRVTVNNNNKH